MSKTKIADEYAEIAARLAEIQREKVQVQQLPKAWPMYAHSDSQADDNSAWGYAALYGYYAPNDYTAPDDDCA